MSTDFAAEIRTWPDFITRGVDGREAFAFIAAVAQRFPTLFAGVGAPFFDPLLERPGFADEWRRAEQGLRKKLTFRLAFLQRITQAEVDPSTAIDVAEDLVLRPWDLTQREESEAVLDALNDIYGVSWRATLSAAIRHKPDPLQALLPFALVRWGLSASLEERAQLALSCDDLFAAYADVNDHAALAALSTQALSFAAEQSVATRARLAAFVLLWRRDFSAPAALLERRALDFSDNFPEERSQIVCEALAHLPEAARAALVLSPPFPWKYAGLCANTAVIDAATAALDNLSASDRAWSIRAFHDFGDAGRAALARTPSANAREILEALDAYARMHPRQRVLDDLAPDLQAAINTAMDALDADPAAWPARRWQFPVLDFGVREQTTGWFERGSWAQVEMWAKTANAALITNELRRLPREAPPAPQRRVRDPCQVELLIALATLILPVWEALRPGDRRPHLVIDDAKNILAGGAVERGEERSTLYDDAYRDNVDRAESSVALTAVWAHSLALDDDGNTVQDTPPDLAVMAFTSLAANGATKSERARRFWETFFLEDRVEHRAF